MLLYVFRSTIFSQEEKNGDELTVLEKLIDLQAKGYRRIKKTNRNTSEKNVIVN